MGSVAKKGLQQYLLQLQKHPLRTKVDKKPLIFNCVCRVFIPLKFVRRSISSVV